MNELLLCSQYCATCYLGVANWFKITICPWGLWGHGQIQNEYRRAFSCVNRGDLSTIIYLCRERNSIDGMYE